MLSLSWQSSEIGLMKHPGPLYQWWDLYLYILYPYISTEPKSKKGSLQPTCIRKFRCSIAPDYGASTHSQRPQLGTPDISFWLLDMNKTEGFQENDDGVLKVCYRAKVAIGLCNALTWKQFSIAVISHPYGALWRDEIHSLMPDVTKTETMR